MNLNKFDLVFISAELSTLNPIENASRTERLSDMLGQRGLISRKVDGAYKGTRETSFLVKIYDLSQLDIIDELSAMFNQESVLYVNRNTQAFIMAGAKEGIRNVAHIGTFMPTVGHNGLTDYTKIDDTYYTVA